MLNRRLVQKADTLLAKEKGTVFKDPGGKVNICLIYPNHYHVGMSNLAIQGLYSMINARADALAERAFLPEEEDISEYQRTETPLFSLETKRPLREFHILAFSVSFENDYPNIIKILKMAGMPPERNRRGPGYPVVMGGGVALTANPEPLAGIFDAIFIGEVEDALAGIIDVFKKTRSKEETLKELALIEGIYIPEAYRAEYDEKGLLKGFSPLWPEVPERIKKRTTGGFHPLFRHAITTEETEFSGMTLVEAMRGCPWRCGFCLAGHIYWPVRHKPLEILEEEATSAKRVGLIGPSLTEYRYIKDALRKGFSCSITSLRAQKRSLEVLELLKDQRSLSIAPESSERLRKALGKDITDEEIIETSRRCMDSGARTLRCYFMVGLPGETERDIEDIISLVMRIRSTVKRGKVVLSVSIFVPKPHTPLQWHPMEREEVVKERIKRLKKALGSQKAVEVFSEVPKYAYLQGLFSRGDRRLGTFLLSLKNISQWQKDLIRSGLRKESYLFRQREKTEPLPWDFIDTGITKEVLWQRYQKILACLRGPGQRHI